MSNSSHDLRQKLEKSDFFKNISSNEFGQNLTGQSGSLFGIGDEKILSCNTNQKVSDLCPRPIHHVNNILLNQSTGHLALWSTIGLSIVNPPLIISKASQFVDLNLGRNYIRKFVWGQDGSFHILTSDNRVHTYSDPDTLESVNRFSIQSTIVDFITFKEGFLLLDSDGNIFENEELVLNCEISGDELQIEQVSNDVLVVANQQMACHILWLEDEAFIIEKVELDFYEEIRILNDKTCAMRYFIFSPSSLVCVSLSWLSDLEKGENITDQHCTVENLLTCPTDSKINGVTVQSGRVPNSITFDGPVLCCSISSGNGILIPLLSLPSQLITSKIEKKSKTSTQPITNKLKQLLEKKTERISLNASPNLSIDDQIEHVARITSRIRKEHLSRGIAVREALINEIALIHKNREKQKQELGKVEVLKGQVRDKAESLSDKFDDIQEKQSELEVRLAKLISSQSNGPLSRAEKEAGRELRTIDRQITQFKKSIQRAKNLSNINPKTENSNLVQEKSLVSLGMVMKPLAEFSDRIETIVSNIKKLQIDSGL